MTRLAFAPVIPLSALAVLIALALLITLYGFAVRARGAWARGLAFTVLLFALAGPMLVKEQHAPLNDVAVIVTDRSQSMALGKRAAQAEAGAGTDQTDLGATAGPGFARDQYHHHRHRRE
jgi:hypothetical protein